MEWRMVFRRSPSRWMTLVGDIAQTGSPAGVDDWAESLAPFINNRFRHHELTVNYRTPSEIMVLANRILAQINPGMTPATAIRDSGHKVGYVGAGADVDKLKEAFDGDRLTAVISSRATFTPGEHHYVVDEIKGLEFDHVIVVDPAGMLEESPQGLQDLYVAVTRATQSLTIVGELPEGLAP